LTKEVSALATVDDVAAAILTRTGSITTMKLQKLVFYCQAWHLAVTGNPLFPERIEAWARGPVVPHLHNRHRGLFEVSAWPAGRAENLDQDAIRTVEWTVQKYGGFSAEALSRMSHQELPWIVARGPLPEGERGATEISHDQLRAFYSRQRSDPDVAVTQAAASALLEGQVIDDEWQEQLRAVAVGTASADDVIAEEMRRAREA
jgi:uncharacterized phage-associated protein